MNSKIIRAFIVSAILDLMELPDSSNFDTCFAFRHSREVEDSGSSLEDSWAVPPIRKSSLLCPAFRPSRSFEGKSLANCAGTSQHGYSTVERTRGSPGPHDLRISRLQVELRRLSLHQVHAHPDVDEQVAAPGQVVLHSQNEHLVVR